MRSFCVLSAFILLAGCANEPITPSFAEYSQQYESLKAAQPARIVFDFNPSCNDDGDCIVSEQRLNDAVQVITKLNDTVENLVIVANDRVSAIGHCEYSAAKLRESLDYLESAGQRAELTGQIKQVITALTCGALLLAQ